jgi:hypothetical protein
MSPCGNNNSYLLVLGIQTGKTHLAVSKRATQAVLLFDTAILLARIYPELGRVVHACNPSTEEDEARG